MDGSQSDWMMKSFKCLQIVIHSSNVWQDLSTNSHQSFKRETPRDIPCLKHYWPPNLIRESDAATFFCQSLHKACEHRWRSVQSSTAEFIALLCGSAHYSVACSNRAPLISQQAAPLTLFSLHFGEKFSQLIFCLAQEVILIQSSLNIGANSAADSNWSR